jgi:hypothetical protein
MASTQKEIKAKQHFSNSGSIMTQIMFIEGKHIENSGSLLSEAITILGNGEPSLLRNKGVLLPQKHLQIRHLLFENCQEGIVVSNGHLEF